MISLRDVVTGFGNRDPLAEVWRRDLRSGGSAEITGTLPLRYIGNGKPLTDYMIYGNTVQNGAPSPEAPVDAVGCGVWDETRQSYKLPITVNSTEYPIYLGQVETTRRIKKLVLTGAEDWSYIAGVTSYSAYYRFKVGSLNSVIANTGEICSHYQLKTISSSSTDIGFSMQNSAGYNGAFAAFRPYAVSSENELATWKNYLAAQYANGTPVTVWYVLAEPETAVVNELLMKIGDYADTISFAQAGVTIPTVSGANVLDMTSTVKPSEVYIKGRGIKPTGYGQLVDKNGVRILDKNDVRILVHGQ